MSLVIFIVFGCVAVGCALAMVFARNPVYGAIALIVCLAALAGEYLLLDAPLLAAFQILVYAGAIMVLYLFVIMLLNVRREEGCRWCTDWRTYLGFALAGLIGISFLFKASNVAHPAPPAGFHVYDVTGVAYTMFTDPTLLFIIEALGVLLLMSVVGAIYLGRRFSAEEESLLKRGEPEASKSKGAPDDVPCGEAAP
ncbi:MAG TPA: NADH-quinone oxidoreductase subunit J [Candidatus Latescibacteria bacterium]|nr:NADH-quinone oxidoreductase subunit J [Candidatus Latescibacterota bacterium]